MFLFRFALDRPDEVHTSFIEVKLKTIFILYLIKVTDNSSDGNRYNNKSNKYDSRVTGGMMNRRNDSPITVMTV